tara:strand:- start:495 stop:890 length:396 start_codon:yes stop_codon:yes gene_type:complete
LIKKISKKDKIVWEEFLRSNEKLYNKDVTNEIRYEDEIKTIDLHGYTLRDANIAVKNLIIKSYNKKVNKIVVITGKGMRSKNQEDPYKSSKLSILKYSVPEFIQNDDELLNKIKKIDLNSGDFIIYLKRKK